jgi:mRNA interferase RelE/StbE
MSKYEVRILDSAGSELTKLDKATARRVVERMDWLAANLREVRHQVLAGELSGLFKLRVGAHRVIYEILHKEEAIVIHAIGHRREIYRKS